MRSGNLKHKITIQEFSKTKNEFKEVVEDWSDVVTEYASIVPVSAKEFFNAGTHAQATHKIEMRYISGIDSTMRVLFGTRIFEISAPPINIREVNKTLQLICTETF